MMATSATTG
jgi:hypothetical protein